MQDNMSAGGESSSEVASPSIVAHESNEADETLSSAWQEYDVLDQARHHPEEEYAAAQHPPRGYINAAPMALSIMRRQRGTGEDYRAKDRGDDVVAAAAADRRVPAAYPPSDYPPEYKFTSGVPPQSTQQQRPNPPNNIQDYHPRVAPWEQDEEYFHHRYYYRNNTINNPYNYGNSYGFRTGYSVVGGGGHHAPMPSFLEDAYIRRHQEMGYEGEMGMMQYRYMPKNKSRDNISASDHGPRTRGGLSASLPPRPSTGARQQDTNGPRSQASSPPSSQPAPIQVPPQSSSQPPPIQVPSNSSPQRRMSGAGGRAYQEMDWKQDRLWREDDHTQTTRVDLNPEADQYQQVVVPTNKNHAVQARVNLVGRQSDNTCVQDCSPSNPSNPCVYHKSIPPPQHPQQLPSHPQHTSRQPKKKKSVSFSSLQVRTYETILGDNPSCSTGPALGLGWRYDPSHLNASVDEYERRHKQSDSQPVDLVLHRYEREAILLNTGYTRHDLADSVRGITKVKNRRRQTVHNLPVAWLEERVEAGRRVLKRWILNKDRTRSLYDDWKRQQENSSSSRQEGNFQRRLSSASF